ncbi:hypothetical protein StoSoilB22_31850 [Arthrobacter sp. StoSoilB22]|nr:hypothetical protein StoSoilB22_31850 [Arthrobacter sp. StoSoilB22]
MAQNAYLYVLWVALLGLFFNVVIRPQFGGVDYTWEGVWAQLLNPISHPWYLYALVVYFVIAKLMARKQWKGVATGVAAALYLGAGHPWLPLPANLCGGLVFFLVGSYWPEVVRLMAYRLNPKKVASLLGAYLGMALVVRLLGISEINAAMLLLSMLAVPASVAIFARFQEHNIVTRGLTWVGKRTLPVYVLHFPLLVIVSWLVQNLPTTLAPSGASNIFYLILPILATLLAAGGALGIHAILTRVPVGTWLFQLPAMSDHSEQRQRRNRSRM